MRWPLFEFGVPPFWDLVHNIRVATLREAARAEVDLIVTHVYAHPSDLEQTEIMFRTVEDLGGSVCPVQLLCDLEVNVQRVQNEGRKPFGKLTSAETFRELSGRLDFRTPIPLRPTLTIDTTAIHPDEAAAGVMEHFGLRVDADCASQRHLHGAIPSYPSRCNRAP